MIAKGRGVIKNKKGSRVTNNFILNRMKEKGVTIEEMRKLLGSGKQTFYASVFNPKQYWTINEMLIISFRLDLELRVVIAYVLGCEGREDKEGKFWFE